MERGKDDIASKSDSVAGESVEGTKRWQLGTAHLGSWVGELGKDDDDIGGAPDFRGIGTMFESEISNIDPDALQDHCVCTNVEISG